MKLEIDWTRCDGHGLCVELLPERIARDEWGFPLVHRADVSAGDAKRARRAVAVCPALALRIEGRPENR
ncbi:MAG TPA: ferredoxin [Jatrophihabitantaceae bacterium]|jgi:ferredoxin